VAVASPVTQSKPEPVMLKQQISLRLFIEVPTKKHEQVKSERQENQTVR
jgi:hypothetical protein